MSTDIVKVEGWELERTDAQAPEYRRRVSDVQVGKALGISRARDIRRLIERHLEELAKYGEISPRVTRARGLSRGKTEGTQTVVEYMLNEGQALCIAAVSASPQAAEVRFKLINAYLTLRNRAYALPEPPLAEEDVRSLLESINHIAKVRCREQPEKFKRVYGEVTQEVRKMTGHRDLPWKDFPLRKRPELVEILTRLTGESWYRLVTPDELYAREIRKIQEDLSRRG